VGAAGRGRWNIGWPGTGRPGTERPCIGRAAEVLGDGAPEEAAGALGRMGALYTGRGPVCGMITRGAGELGAAGAAGLAATGAGVTEAAGGAAAGGGAGR